MVQAVKDPVQVARRTHDHEAAKKACQMFVNQMAAAGLSPAAQMESAVMLFKVILTTHVRSDKAMVFFQKIVGEMREDVRSVLSAGEGVR